MVWTVRRGESEPGLEADRWGADSRTGTAGRVAGRAEGAGEFDLIRRHFTRPARRAVVGVGDDCALLAPTPGMHWAVSTDTLVEGRHFLSTVAPARLGHKALAVNLSDLAACGARPVAFTLALSLPRADEAWLTGFAAGLFALADAHDIELVGGDTTAGPLTIHISVFGEVPPGTALLRSGARPGDDLWVSGMLGDARLALEGFRGTVDLPGDVLATVRRALEQPQPRVALGSALRGIASAAIDLSDGLLGDLGHVLDRSGVGAELWSTAIPHSRALADQSPPLRRLCLLTGGDDYELLFTAPPGQRPAVEAAGRATGVAVHPIGRIRQEPGFTVLDGQGQPIDLSGLQAFDHFKSS